MNIFFSIRPRLRSEEGAALTAALFLGLAMILLSAVVMTRALGQSDAEFADETYEHAIQSAEAGVNLAITELAADSTFTTGESMVSLGTKADVIAAADAKPDSDVIQTPDGELVLIVPTDGGVVFGVGYVPSRDHPQRKVRVIETAVDQLEWVPDFGMWVGGDIEIKGRKPGDKKEIDIWGIKGRVHVEGELKLEHDLDKPPSEQKGVDGCITTLDLWDPKHPQHNDIYSNEDTVNNPDCPLTADVVSMPLPDIDPRRLYKLSHYVVCPAGLRYGPNWPQGDGTPAPPGSVIPIVPADLTTLDPCLGSMVLDPLVLTGIEDGLGKPTERVKFKDKKNDVEGPVSAVYYVVSQNVELKIEDDQSLEITIIVEKYNNELNCWGGAKTDGKGGRPKLEDKQRGDTKAEVKKTAIWTPHPDAYPYALLTAGDLELKAKGKEKKDEQGRIEGFIWTNEQLKFEGSDLSDPLETPGGIRGVIIAENACDTKDSKLDKLEWKKGDIVWGGEFVVPADFVGMSTGVVAQNSSEM